MDDGPSVRRNRKDHFSLSIDNEAHFADGNPWSALNLDFVLEAEKPEFVAGQVFKDCDECPEMVVIPEGSFVMGGSQSDEQPQHRVTVPKFAMGKYEVTFDEYDAYARSTGRNL